MLTNTNNNNNNNNNNNFMKKRSFYDTEDNEHTYTKRSLPYSQDRVVDFNCPAFFNSQVDTIYLSHVLKNFSSIVLFFYECDFKSSAIKDIELVRSYYNHFINQRSLPIMISTDTTAVHQAFFSSNIKGALQPTPFPILADVTRLITRYFGVMNEKTGNPNRSVFIINANQEIKYSYIPLFTTTNEQDGDEEQQQYSIPQILSVITAICQDG